MDDSRSLGSSPWFGSSYVVSAWSIIFCWDVLVGFKIVVYKREELLRVRRVWRVARVLVGFSLVFRTLTGQFFSS